MNELATHFAARVFGEVIPVIQTKRPYKEIRNLDSQAPDVLEFISITFANEDEYAGFERNIEDIRHEILRILSSSFTTWAKIEVYINLRLPTEDPESKNQPHGVADIEIQLFSE